MSVEKAIKLLGQTFIVKDELVMDLIRDTLRELGDVDMVGMKASTTQKYTNKDIDLLVAAIRLQNSINYDFMKAIDEIKAKLCKFEGDGR